MVRPLSYHNEHPYTHVHLSCHESLRLSPDARALTVGGRRWVRTCEHFQDSASTVFLSSGCCGLLCGGNKLAHGVFAYPNLWIYVAELYIYVSSVPSYP